jgi:hypothetical protein
MMRDNGAAGSRRLSHTGMMGKLRAQASNAGEWPEPLGIARAG